MWLSAAEVKNPNTFTDKETGAQLEIEAQEPFIEWMAENYKQFGCRLDYVSDQSQEGSQYVRGFGGIGGVLRWPLEFEYANEDDLDSEDDLGDYYM